MEEDRRSSNGKVKQMYQEVILEIYVPVVLLVFVRPIKGFRNIVEPLNSCNDNCWYVIRLNFDFL